MMIFDKIIYFQTLVDMLATVSGQELFSLGGETEEGKGGMMHMSLSAVVASVAWLLAPSLVFIHGCGCRTDRVQFITGWMYGCR